ncbi:glycosyltransferase [Oligoflexia bacterium]|nr:glycosyltransferase [Oligoflexia bacterium]
MPLISIVTPSFNQGHYLECAIRSVLLQNYPNLEYIVIDGNSKDGSVDIIKKYEKWITYWASESDEGQSDALLKGFNRATGTIFGWLCSDDYYQPGALWKIAKLYNDHPEAVAWAGMTTFVEVRTGFRRSIPLLYNGENRSEEPIDLFARVPQPSCLFSASAYENVGRLNKRLHYTMDPDLYFRLSRVGDFVAISEEIAIARNYKTNKSSSDVEMRVVELIANYWNLGYPQLARQSLVKFLEKGLPLRYVFTRVLKISLIRSILRFVSLFKKLVKGDDLT